MGKCDWYSTATGRTYCYSGVIREPLRHAESGIER